MVLPILEEDGHPGPHRRTTHTDVLEMAAHGHEWQLSSERGRSLCELRRSEPSGNHRHWEGLLELPMLGDSSTSYSYCASGFYSAGDSLTSSYVPDQVPTGDPPWSSVLTLILFFPTASHIGGIIGVWL